MLPIAIAATALAIFPMTDRCRSVIMHSGFVPEIEFSAVAIKVDDFAEAADEDVLLTASDVSSVGETCVGLRQYEEPEALWVDVTLDCPSGTLSPDLWISDAPVISGLQEPVVCSASGSEHDLMLFSPMTATDADVIVRSVVSGSVPDSVAALSEFEAQPLAVTEAVVTIARLALGLPLEAERKFWFAYVASPVRDAVPRPPDVLIPDPRSLPSNVLATAVGKLIYDALADGSVNARAPKWRMPLVQMLVDGTPGTDFDRVYGFLLRTFGGNDERTKIRALAKWTGENLAPREAADVYRAETRYWLNLGDSAMTVDAAKRMERARPDYAVRARRLSALSYATSGELEKAKAEIARSRAECDLPSYERLELLYLEAWIWLQEGDVGAARRNLNSIVNESSRSALARKALSILESIPKED